MKHFTFVALLTTQLLLVGSAVAKPPAKPAAAPAVTSPKPEAKPAAVQIVEIKVTGDGFVPAEVKVKAGQPVKLKVTRQTDKTCAKDIVIKALGVNKALPLDAVVEIDLAPMKPGAVRFACAMDMIAGTLIAE